MGKLLTNLEKQLKTENKKDAEDCMKIYDKLKEMDNGCIWESKWSVLVGVKFSGSYPNNTRTYKPSPMGYVFLQGLENYETEDSFKSRTDDEVIDDLKRGTSFGMK